jgi:putative membrane protein
MSTAGTAAAIPAPESRLRITTAGTAVNLAFRDNRLLHVFCAVFTVVLVGSGIRPVMPLDWWLENLLVFLFLGVMAATYRRFALSELSYLLIFVFLCLHEWGAHYRYAIDPVGEWVKHAFGTVRNPYDRVVHYAFGLLMAYPQRELLLRRSGLTRAWASWVTVLVMVGYGGIYEILEAGAAAVLSPDAGEAFLALQGDEWDTHKDMLMELTGAMTAMIVTGIRGRRHAGPDRVAAAGR